MTAFLDHFLNRHFTRPSITWRQALLIVLPLMAENIFTQMFGLLNSAMISSSGTTALSAVSLVDTLNSFLLVFYSGIATGASVVVANYRGKGDPEKLHEASVQAVTTVTLFTIVTAVFVIVFHAPLLNLLFGAAEQDVMDKARLYMIGGALSLPIVGIPTAICGVLRGIGEGKIAMVYVMISSAIYVALNVLFLTVLNWEIPGLICSVALSRILNLPTIAILKRRGDSHFRFQIRELFHINRSIFTSIFKIGMPCATEQLFFQAGRLVTQAIIVPMGTNAIVTYNISYSLMTISQVLGGPIHTSMYTIAGICMGHGRPQDIRELTRSYDWFGRLCYLVSLGLMLLGFQLLVDFYHAPEEVVSTIFLCVMMTCIAQPLIHNNAFMLPSVFRAVGDGNYCTVASLMIMWVVRVFGGYVLGVWMSMGVVGIWIAMVLDWLARAVVFPIRFRGDRWLKHQVTMD